MSKIKRLTLQEVENLIATEEYIHIHNKVTVGIFQLANDYVLVVHSGTIDPNNFDKEKGEAVVREKAITKIYELEGYALHYRT